LGFVRQHDFNDRVAQTLFAMMYDSGPQILEFTPGHRERSTLVGIVATQLTVDPGELFAGEEGEQSGGALSQLLGALDLVRVAAINAYDVGDVDGLWV
jgi:hypothetical protein